MVNKTFFYQFFNTLFPYLPPIRNSSQENSMTGLGFMLKLVPKHFREVAFTFDDLMSQNMLCIA
jgi:hypothetical protein